MFSTYAQILRHPGALLFSATGLFARLQMSMASLGATLLIVHYRDSYALAAMITATYALSAALIGPQVSRMVDRFGQARVVPLQLVVHVPSMLALVFMAMQSGWTALLFVLSVLAGAAQPSIGPLIRARWAKIYHGTPHLRTAFAMESLVDEIVFITGPPLATALAVYVAPASALLVATTFLTVGSTLLILQKDTQPVASGRFGAPAPKGTAILLPGVAAVASVYLFLGAVFGAFEIVTVGYAEQEGVKGATGVLLALYSAGSLVAGFLFGAYRGTASLPRQFLTALIMLGVVSTPISFMPNVIWMGVAALLAGSAVAPVLISGMALVEHAVPGNRLTESMTWVSGGLSVGLAGGMLLSGALLDHYDAQVAYLVVSGAGLGAMVVGLLLRPRIVGVYWDKRRQQAQADEAAHAVVNG